MASPKCGFTTHFDADECQTLLNWIENAIHTRWEGPEDTPEEAAVLSKLREAAKFHLPPGNTT